MGLWLEHRDESGKLIASGRLVEGMVTHWALEARPDVSPDFGLAAALNGYTLDEARQLCRFSSHLPIEQRDWVLRIRSERR